MNLATEQTLESGTAERRGPTRYPVTGRAEYRTMAPSENRGRRYGNVVNLSSGGLMMECQDGLQPGLQVEVMIPWPAGHGKALNLHLHVVGSIVRAEGNRAAIQIEQSAFRFDR